MTAGIDAIGPESPNIVVEPTVRGVYDEVITMYHDQRCALVEMYKFVLDETVRGVSIGSSQLRSQQIL